MILQIAETTSPHCLKSDPSEPQGPKSFKQPETNTADREEEAWYLCRSCNQQITRPSHQIQIQGEHRHTFANPSGVVFDIGCFGSAQGFSFMGPPSTEFTWFSGYSWRITICASCLNHIGWFFSSSGDSFFGFIVDQLILRSLPKSNQ